MTEPGPRCCSWLPPRPESRNIECARLVCTLGRGHDGDHSASGQTWPRYVRESLHAPAGLLKGDLLANLMALVSVLPEQHATKSRDYGRGYAQAIRDVMTLISPTETSKDA